jgi:trans-aconitate methyltransferase
MRFFADSTNEVWQALGQDDPYFGVLSCDEYTRNNLSDSNLEKFFQSGETAIVKLLSSIDALGLKLQFGSVLDFGCGVGRLLIPLANRFEKAVGIDVSEGMLNECRSNLASRHLTNVMLSTSLPSSKCDLVHSALVFQHIRPKRGIQIILDCWSRVAPDGLLAIQLPIRSNLNSLTWLLRQVRNAIPIIQVPYNIAVGKRWNKPGLQMNVYDLNSLAARLLDNGASQITLLQQPSDQFFSGVYLLASKR